MCGGPRAPALSFGGKSRHRAELTQCPLMAQSWRPFFLRAMSAFGPKRTYVAAPHMSAFGGKADMPVFGNPLSRSLLGVKRT